MRADTPPTPTEALLRQTFAPHAEVAIEQPYLRCIHVWEIVGYVAWRGGVVEKVRLLRTEPLPSRKGLLP